VELAVMYLTVPSREQEKTEWPSGEKLRSVTGALCSLKVT
jgi:hypothetical protein